MILSPFLQVTFEHYASFFLKKIAAFILEQHFSFPFLAWESIHDIFYLPLSEEAYAHLCELGVSNFWLDLEVFLTNEA
jgi:hypothetical protein